MRSTDIDSKQPTGELAPVLARDKLTKGTSHAFYVTGTLAEVDLGVGAVLHIHPALGILKAVSPEPVPITPTTVEVVGV